MSKYIMAMTVCNRLEKNGTPTLDLTIDSLKKSGLWQSKIDFTLVLHDSGSVDTSYLDKYESLPNVLVVKSKEKAGILKNAVLMLKYICKNLQADYILYIEDDILFCKNWIENLDHWTRSYIRPADWCFSFYCPYEHLSPFGLNIFNWRLDSFYGTQCFGVPFDKLASLTDFFEKKNKEGYERGNDMFLSEWIRISSRKESIKTSYPSIVQHMAIGSTLDSYAHKSPSFLGEDIDPKFY